MAPVVLLTLSLHYIFVLQSSVSNSFQFISGKFNNLLFRSGCRILNCGCHRVAGSESITIFVELLVA